MALLISSGKNEEEVSELMEHFFKTETENNSPELFTRVTEKVVDEDTIGIWKLEETGGQFVYSRDINCYNEWHLWANVSKIPLVKEKNRIVLLGESVARGYFYDPYYNPAIALKNILAAQRTYPESEVIDLARTSLGLEQLYEVFDSCIKLKPDTIVIFAGNNWWTTLEDAVKELAREKDLLQLQAGGLTGIRTFLENELKNLVSDFIRHVSEISLQHNIKVVFVIPEFNLGDWKSTKSEQVVSRLPEGKTIVWLNTRQEAEEALALGNFEKAEELARKMILLDNTHPLGYEFLASGLSEKRLFKEARQALEKARDTAILFRSSSKPRMFSVIKETILSATAKSGTMEVVDLAAVFAAEIVDYMPDRELFLDYCHLTVKGIELSMMAVAKCLMNGNFSNEGYTPVVLPAKIEAMAHLFAAIHNAHLGQGKEIISYHCLKAVKEPKVQKFMALYTDMASRNIQSILCRSFEKIVENGDLEQYQKGTELLHANGKKKLDLNLVDTMVSAMESTGVSMQKSIADLRVSEHALIDRVDLLSSYYSLNDYESAIPLKVSYYQSRFTESDFVLFVREAADAELSLVSRVVNQETEPQFVEIYINGQLLDTLILLQFWKQDNVTIPAAYLKPGMNSITVKWPISTDVFNEILTAKNSHISAGSIFNSMYHIFGELQQLTVSI